MSKKIKVAGEFKEFIMRGNILDMAVGVIMGGAFGKIVSSVVSDIIMPVIGLISGGVNFTDLKLPLTGDPEGAAIAYGAFIQNVVDFLIIALCMFICIKAMAKITAKFKKETPPEPEAEPVKSDEVLLLEEIRDLLKNRQDAEK